MIFVLLDALRFSHVRRVSLDEDSLLHRSDKVCLLLLDSLAVLLTGQAQGKTDEVFDHILCLGRNVFEPLEVALLRLAAEETSHPFVRRESLHNAVDVVVILAFNFFAISFVYAKVQARVLFL